MVADGGAAVFKAATWRPWMEGKVSGCVGKGVGKEQDGAEHDAGRSGRTGTCACALCGRKHARVP